MVTFAGTELFWKLIHSTWIHLNAEDGIFLGVEKMNNNEGYGTMADPKQPPKKHMILALQQSRITATPFEIASIAWGLAEKDEIKFEAVG